MGNYNYILLSKENNDTSSWNEISQVPLAKDLPKEIINDTNLHSTGILEQIQNNLAAGKLVSPTKIKQTTMEQIMHEDIQTQIGTIPKIIKRQNRNVFNMFSEDEPLSKKSTNDPQDEISDAEAKQ